MDDCMVKLSLKRKNIPKGVDIIMSSSSLSKNCGKLVLKQSTSLCGKLPRVSFPEENPPGLRGPWAPSCVWLSVNVYYKWGLAETDPTLSAQQLLLSCGILGPPIQLLSLHPRASRLWRSARSSHTCSTDSFPWLVQALNIGSGTLMKVRTWSLWRA